MRNQQTIISISGGLGNQLFQTITAYNVSDTSKILIDQDSHQPQKNSSNQLAVGDFDLLTRIGAIDRVRFPKFIQRIISLNLRSSFSKDFNSKFLKFISKLAIEVFLLLKFLRFFQVVTPASIELLPNRLIKKNLFLNGYFQNKNSILTDKSRSLLQSISLNEYHVDLDTWISEAKLIAPIVLHFRIGDYKDHPGMGILDSNYFAEAVNLARKDCPGKEIWVFSDEPSSASQILQGAGIKKFRVMPTLSPSKSIELMRYGSAFIISNSTFSWWAAALRYDRSAQVWAPTPWFRHQESPGEFYFDDWHKVVAWRNVPDSKATENHEVR